MHKAISQYISNVKQDIKQAKFHTFDPLVSLHSTRLTFCPVGWGCRIHRLHLCNKYPGYYTKQSNGEVQVILMLALGNAEYPFTAIAPNSTLARTSST